MASMWVTRPSDRTGTSNSTSSWVCPRGLGAGKSSSTSSPSVEPRSTNSGSAPCECGQFNVGRLVLDKFSSVTSWAALSSRD